MATAANPASKPKKLNEKQKMFCHQYIIDLNATQAAIRAGYSKKTAYSIGHENLRKPEIQTFIKAKLQEAALGAEETTKLISDIARGNLTNYLKTTKVERKPKIEKRLSELIAELEEEIRFEKEVHDRLVGVTKEEKQAFAKQQEGRQRQLIRYQVELEHNPKATKIVNGPAQLVDDYVIDMDALKADQERGRVKSIEQTRYGLKVELYSADDALTNMARIHGQFEKDNKQKNMQIKVTRK